jgi:PTS system nitrogen regulatory IIA component
VSFNLEELLSPTRIDCAIEAASKKRIFEIVAEKIASSTSGIEENDIYTQLLAREKLGSTGLGTGVAIPHCRVAGCQRPIGSLLTLAEPVDYDAIDRQPVDLVFALVVPEEATQIHLDILAELARRFSSAKYSERLRSSRTSIELLAAALEDPEAP